MGRNARLRKLRREARRQFQTDPAKTEWIQAYQDQHPEAIVMFGGASEKMSEVLEDFAEPLLSAADTPDDTKKALMLAMVAWNYSLLEETGSAQSEAPFSTFLADPGMRRILEFLRERKRLLYPDNRRVILDFQLIPNGTEFQFNVISTIGTIPTLPGAVPNQASWGRDFRSCP